MRDDHDSSLKRTTGPADTRRTALPPASREWREAVTTLMHPSSDAPDAITLAAPARRTASRALWWIPLALLVAALAVSWATGRGPVPNADATVVSVTGTVDSEVYLDATGCAPASVAIGELVAGTDGWKTAQDVSGQSCSIAFGTTHHAPGTDLKVLEDPAAVSPPTAAMKCVAGCIGSALDDYDAPAEPAAGTSAFGAQLLSASGAASSTWSTAPAVHAIGASSTACRTSAPGTGTCAFTFGATAAISDPAGSYRATTNFVVLAR